MLAEQKKLEDQYIALVAEQPQLRNMPNKNKLYENQKEVHAVAEQLRLGTQALVRNLKVKLLIGNQSACAVPMPKQPQPAAIPVCTSLNTNIKRCSRLQRNPCNLRRTL